MDDAISRVKTFASYVIEPMKSSANLQYMLAEENTLDHLAQTTHSSAI